MNGFQEHDSATPLDIHGGNGESERSAFGFKASYDWKVGRRLDQAGNPGGVAA